MSDLSMLSKNQQDHESTLITLYHIDIAFTQVYLFVCLILSEIIRILIITGRPNDSESDV